MLRDGFETQSYSNYGRWRYLVALELKVWVDVRLRGVLNPELCALDVAKTAEAGHLNRSQFRIANFTS